jgi:hypothetical protein
MKHQHTMIHTSIGKPAQCYYCGEREKESEHKHELIQSDGGHSGIPFLFCSAKECEYEEYPKKERAN